MSRHHPEELMLVEYAAGSLSAGPCAAITAHLSFCDKCQAHVDSLTDVAAAYFTAEQDYGREEIATDSFDKVLAAIDEPSPQDKSQQARSTDPVATTLPGCVNRILPQGNLAWRKLTSSLKVAPIGVGERNWELALHRITAGGKAPHHDHGGKEYTVVLTGSFSDEDGVYQPGDFLTREPGDRHRPLAAQHEDCICLSVLEAPIRLTGMKRLLNPFLGFNPA